MSKKKNEGVFLFGLPCSGKSTWFKANVDKYKNYIYISADELKKSMYGYDESVVGMFSDEAIKAAGELARKCIKKGTNFIMDGGSINNNYTTKLLTACLEKGFDTHMVNIDTPYTICLERNEKRDRKVPNELIINREYMRGYQWSRYLQSELLTSYEIVPYFTEKNVFFDMDGVLAAQIGLPKVNGKIDFVNSRCFRYLPVVEPVQKRVRKMHQSGHHNIYILSAAPTSISGTEKWKWLDDNFGFIKKENIYFVNSGKFKAEMFNDLSTKLKLDRRSVMLVEDTHHIIQAVRQEYNMHSIHVSEFLCKYS